jgi:hypothetical protein
MTILCRDRASAIVRRTAKRGPIKAADWPIGRHAGFVCQR